MDPRSIYDYGDKRKKSMTRSNSVRSKNWRKSINSAMTANYLLENFGNKAKKPTSMENFRAPSFNREISTESQASTISEDDTE